MKLDGIAVISAFVPGLVDIRLTPDCIDIIGIRIECEHLVSAAMKRKITSHIGPL